MNDWQLLQEYVERESEPAFRSLVERHLGLVHGTALRQLRDPHLAEDVAQAVFILLARKARGFRSGVVLPGWLFRTTRFVAARALRTEQRRQRREQETFSMQPTSSSPPADPQSAPLLDEALSSLGAKDRDAVLLRFTHDRSLRQVGEQLGLGEEAAKKRVSRAVDKLRGFFANRGFTLSTTALTGLLVEQLGQGAPAGMAAQIVARSLTVGASASATAPLLVRETLNAWAWAKVKLVGTLAIVGITGLGLVWSLTPENPEPNSTYLGDEINSLPSATTETASASISPAPLPVARSGERFLRLTAVAKETGEPISNARVALNVVSGGEWLQRYDLATDERGGAAVPYPVGAVRIDVGVLAWGWAARYVTWHPDRDDPIPADYTLRLERTSDTLGGWIRDSDGQPLAGAEVIGRLGQTGDASNRETPRERFGFQGEAPLARTDRNGFWTAGVIPRASHEGFELWARHPGFSKSFIIAGAPARTTDEQSAAFLEPLWSGQLVTLARRGVTLTGRVLDETGTPVMGARIVHAPFTLEPIEVETSAEGWFAVSGLEPGTFDFTVTASGFAPTHREVILGEGAPPGEIRLKPGATLQIRVVDEKGDAVPDATIGLEQWGEQRHTLKWAGETDVEGNLIWDSAPGGVDLDLYARKSGWCYTRDIKLQADGLEHTVVMRPTLTVTGRVIDADSGEPVLKAKAFPGYGTEDHCWERLDTRRAADGTFKVVFSEKRDPWRVRVEADGYAPFVSEELKPDFADKLEVQLKPLDAATAVSGLVLQPDGQPAAGTEVALLTLEHNVVVQGTRFARSPEDRLVVETDATGRFRFPPDGMAHTAVAVGESGFVVMGIRSASGPVTLRLQAWGRIEGVVDASAREKPIQSVVLDVPINRDISGRFGFNYPWVAPGDDGRFAFERVPPIPMVLWLNPGVGKGYFHHQTPVEVTPGATVRVVIATTGVVVTGRLATTGAERDWTKEFRYAGLNTDEPALTLPSGLSDTERKLWQAELWNSEAGLAQAVKNRSVTMEFASDGSFRSNAPLPPGAYRLRATIGSHHVNRPVIIPESSEAGIHTFDLGSMPIPAEALAAAE